MFYINHNHMALFRDHEMSNEEVKTIIGPSVKVEGNFSGEGSMAVEGVVQGSLKTNSNLQVGPQAKIKAEVEARNLFLSGEIRGNIKVTEKSKLTSTARVFGNIDTGVLSVEEGAIINGKCTMNGQGPHPEPEARKQNKP